MISYLQFYNQIMIIIIIMISINAIKNQGSVVLCDSGQVLNYCRALDLVSTTKTAQQKKLTCIILSICCLLFQSVSGILKILVRQVG